MHVLFDLFIIALAVLMVIGNWVVFTKANKPGWTCLVPIYNLIVVLDIIGRPRWWLFLLMIPLANFVFLVIVFLDLAKAFGKGTGFGVGLLLLGFIFFPILAFGEARYAGAPLR